MSEPSTTIRITRSVRDELLSRGRMGESYSDVIRRLLSESQHSAPPSRRSTSNSLFVRPES